MDDFDLTKIKRLNFDFSKINEEGLDAFEYLINLGVLQIFPGKAPISGLELLPYYNFKDVILNNPQLTNLDISALCNSSCKLQSYCSHNQEEIWRDLLKRDYSLSFRDLLPYFDSIKVEPSPKRAYQELSKYAFVKDYLTKCLNYNKYQEYGHKWRVYAANQWLQHQEKISGLIGEHYSPGDWFDWLRFENWMMERMGDTFFTYLSDASDDINVDGEPYEIDFKFELGFALISNHIDEGVSAGHELVGQLSECSIEITEGFKD